MINPDDLPDTLNLGFGDSASQRPNDLLSGVIPTVHDLKSRPFASNLENAKILARLTKHRVERLEIQPPTGNINDYLDVSSPAGAAEAQQEYEKQKRINKYLNGTLKHLNMTVDILIEQYDPVKLKSLKDKFGAMSQNSTYR